MELNPLGLINGYRNAGADGSIYDFGTSRYRRGGANNWPLAAPIVQKIKTEDNQGRWLIGANDGVFSHRDETYYGSEVNLNHNKSLVRIMTSHDGG